MEIYFCSCDKVYIYRFKEIGGHFKIYAIVVGTLYKVAVNAYSMIISLFNLPMEFGGIF